MNILTIFPFLAFFVNLTLGCFIIYVNPKNKINQLFSIVLFSLALWSIGNFLTFTSFTPENAVFWSKLGTLGASLTASFLLHFFLVFTKSKFLIRKLNVIIFYLPLCFFIIVNLFTNLIAHSAQPAYWGYSLNKGPLYYLHTIYVVTFIVAGFVICYRYFLIKANENEKIQAKYLIIAISIPLVGGIISEVIIPYMGFNLMPLSTTLTTIMSIIIACVIVKFNLMTPFSFGIERKMTASFLTIVILVSAIGLFSIAESQSLLYDNIGSGSTLLASETMDKIDNIIERRIEEFKMYSLDDDIQKNIINSNYEFSLLGTEDEIYNFINKRDSEWISNNKNASSLIFEINNSVASNKLKSYRDFFNDRYNYTLFGEIFITNKYGANIGQTGITSDYFQADEIWWSESVHNSIYIGNIAYDESAGIYSIDISLRIEDLNGSFIGVLKIVWNIEEIVNIIKDSISSKDYESYSTMNFILLDDTGRLIYSTTDFNFLDYEYDLLNHIESHLSNKESFFSIMSIEDSDENDKLIAFAYSKGFKDFNFTKFILVLQHDADTIFSSVTNLRNLIIFVSLFMIITGISLGFFISRSISKPIIKLRNATAEISNGNLDTKIDIKSNDELGELSYAFNNMKMEIKKSKKQIEKYSIELEKLLKQKDDFINQLGHDLKNPLGPLINLLPLLKEEEKNANKREMINIMIRNVGYMKNLTVKTIELAKLNSPNTQFTFQEMNLLEIINNVIETNQLLLQEKHINITKDVNCDIYLEADQLRIEELLNNLINNAIKYSNDGSAINISAWNSEESIIVAIQDSGIGMTDEEIRHIFDEFYKADSSRHDFDSSGLGMPICKSIIEKHGGRIWAESKGRGKGSTFYFALPRHQSHIIETKQNNYYTYEEINSKVESLLINKKN